MTKTQKTQKENFLCWFNVTAALSLIMSFVLLGEINTVKTHPLSEVCPSGSIVINSTVTWEETVLSDLYGTSK